jgi:outer membrane protein assembly factor BamB
MMRPAQPARLRLRLPPRWRGLLAFVVLSCLGPGARADDWPQWLGPQRDGVWREKGILDKFPKGGPKVRWRAPVGGGYAGPAVAGGRVYVTDRVLAPGVKDDSNPFKKARSPSKERVLCLDEASGKVLWKREYDCTYTIQYPSGPRATPLVHAGKVYTLGAMGDLRCLDVRDGKLLWSKNFVKDYDARLPIWGFSAAPLLDGDRLICLVGGKGSAVVAFDKDTGREKWKALTLDSADVGYCAPMIYTVGGTRQLIVWHPESVNGLNPETGKPYWSQEWLIRANMTIPTPRLVGDQLFLTCFYNGSMMLRLTGGAAPTAKVLWQSRSRSEFPKDTDKLHGVMCTPFLKEGHIYGVCSYGQLRCLDVKDGRRVWEDLKASGCDAGPERWANAFLVPQGDRFFIANEKGDLIIARLTPRGYEEIDRAHILDATNQLGGFGGRRKVVWSHPAFANKAMYARNDKEIVCVSLAAEAGR